MGAASMTSLTSQNQFASMPANRHSAGAVVATPELTGGMSHGHGRVGRVLAERYRLEKLLGHGAMGEVFRARDLKRRQWCAIKLVFPGAELSLQAHRRFVQEAMVVARLSHHNIVEVREFNEDSDGTKFLVMELLEGVDLQTVLGRISRMPLDRVLRIVKGVGAALQYAHDLGVVHRDVKPDNIFLSQQRNADGQIQEVPKMLDFGLAKLFSDTATTGLIDTQESDQPVTRGIVVGTPAYLPPEVAMGQVGAVDPRADQWSLAVVAYQMMAGQLPYDHKNPYQLCQLICSGEHPLLSEVAPGLPTHIYSTIETALSNDPEKRFRSIKDFLRALDNLPSPSEARVVPTATRASERPAPQDTILKTVQYSADELKALTQKSRRHSEPIPKEQQEQIPTAPYLVPMHHLGPPPLPVELKAALECSAKVTVMPLSDDTTRPPLPGMTRALEPQPADDVVIERIEEEKLSNLPRPLATSEVQLPQLSQLPQLPQLSQLSQLRASPIEITLADFGAQLRLRPDEMSATMAPVQNPVVWTAPQLALPRMLVTFSAVLIGLSVLLAFVAVYRLRIMRQESAALSRLQEVRAAAAAPVPQVEPLTSAGDPFDMVTRIGHTSPMRIWTIPPHTPREKNAIAQSPAGPHPPAARSSQLKPPALRPADPLFAPVK